MPTVFDKLNLKDEKEIVVLNAPASFEEAVGALDGVKVLRSASKVKEVQFAVVFAVTQAELDAATAAIAPKAGADAKLWFAYPKQSSKKYKCEFNRDTGWDKLGAAGFEPVRMVAVDEDWSALRFRRVEKIKTLTRSFAISEAGKERTAEVAKKGAVPATKNRAASAAKKSPTPAAKTPAKGTAATSKKSAAKKSPAKA